VDGICYTKLTASTVEVAEIPVLPIPGVAPLGTVSKGNNLQAPRREDSYEGEIIVPSTVTTGGVTYTVTGVGAQAFHSSDVTKVTLPETITYLGTLSF
jgi:hypothetical protein